MRQRYLFIFEVVGAEAIRVGVGRNPGRCMRDFAGRSHCQCRMLWTSQVSTPDIAARVKRHLARSALETPPGTGKPGGWYRPTKVVLGMLRRLRAGERIGTIARRPQKAKATYVRLHGLYLSPAGRYRWVVRVAGDYCWVIAPYDPRVCRRTSLNAMTEWWRPGSGKFLGIEPYDPNRYRNPTPQPSTGRGGAPKGRRSRSPR